ncbi:MAG: hypothetical protein D6793_05865 [Thermoflexia bacterium]|nr:MAG: hypothetical protein D6793_05865 [Thermoflexia bacterium]
MTVLCADKPKRSAWVQGLTVLDGILRFIGQHRPLLTFSLMGLLLLMAGMGWGFCVVEIYRRTQALAVGYALICVTLIIVGTICISTGFILHSLRGLILNLFQNANH